MPRRRSPRGLFCFFPLLSARSHRRESGMRFRSEMRLRVSEAAAVGGIFLFVFIFGCVCVISLFFLLRIIFFFTVFYLFVHSYFGGICFFSLLSVLILFSLVLYPLHPCFRCLSFLSFILARYLTPLIFLASCLHSFPLSLPRLSLPSYISPIPSLPFKTLLS